MTKATFSSKLLRPFYTGHQSVHQTGPVGSKWAVFEPTLPLSWTGSITLGAPGTPEGTAKRKIGRAPGTLSKDRALQPAFHSRPIHNRYSFFNQRYPYFRIPIMNGVFHGIFRNGVFPGGVNTGRNAVYKPNPSKCGGFLLNLKNRTKT